MQIGKHYAVTIRGETYYTVCVGTDDTACYLEDINGNLLSVPFQDETAFSTVYETGKFSEELNQINAREADRDFDLILEEAFAAKKLITPETPLPTRQSVDITMAHLQHVGERIRHIELMLQGIGYEAAPLPESRQTEHGRAEPGRTEGAQEGPVFAYW